MHIDAQVEPDARGASAPRSIAEERGEWLDALDGVIAAEGLDRARELVGALVERAETRGVRLPDPLTTPYVNTIPVERAAAVPRRSGDRGAPAPLRALERDGDGRAREPRGDATSAVTSRRSRRRRRSIDVGFNHFWHAPSAEHGGDLVYFQGHSSPGVYARAFLEGRICEEQLDHFRREVDGNGLSSYPHPWLMPDFWQFADRVDGPRTAAGRLPSALHEVPARSRHRRHERPQGLGVRRRR